MFHQGMRSFSLLLRQTHCYGSISFIIHEPFKCNAIGTNFLHFVCEKKEEETNLPRFMLRLSLNTFHGMMLYMSASVFSLESVCGSQEFYNCRTTLFPFIANISDKIASPSNSLLLLTICTPNGFRVEVENQWRMSLNSMDYCLFIRQARSKRNGWCCWFSKEMKKSFSFHQVF